MEIDFKDRLTKNDTKDKYIFWDIDGTLAPYRFNGHVGVPGNMTHGISMDEINNNIFLKRLPSKFMQHVVKTSKAKSHIVMGHVLCEKEIEDKNTWLDKHFPIIKDRILTYEDIPKHQSILNYCAQNNINIKDVIFVDDVLMLIREAEAHGIKSYHISSLLDWDFN